MQNRYKAFTVGAVKAPSFELDWQPIVSIVPDGFEPCVCIQIDHPSRLYITDDGIVTHNTTVEGGKDDTVVEPGFYSQLQRTLQAKMPKVAGVDQIKAIISNPQNKVKADELKWSGVLPWLEGKGAGAKVSQQEIMDYLRNEGSVRFEEVQLAQFKPTGPDLDKIANQLDSAEGTFLDVFNDIGEEEKTASANFDRAIQKASEAARNGNASEALRWTERASDIETDFGDNPATHHILKMFDDVDTKDDTQYSDYQLPGGENYREVVLTMPRGDNEFTSSHFSDIPNYLAHMRLNDRTLGDGTKTLHSEEYQSDRHQDARGKGYKGEIPNHFEIVPFDSNYEWFNPSRHLPGGYVVVNKNTGRSALGFWGPNLPTIEAAQKAIGNRDEGSIPDAPFRQSRDWGLQLVKRQLRDAVNGDYGAISWTPGLEQVDRYNQALRQVVDRISWVETDDGKVIRAVKDGNVTFKGTVGKDGLFTNGEAKGKSLSEVLGKEVADKVQGDAAGDLQGDNLTIGGEGMKGFYDQILPTEVAKYVKQWGAKVEPATVDAEGKQVPVFAVKITPEMREGVKSGQALFSAAKAPEAETEEAGQAARPALSSPHAALTAPDPISGAPSHITGARVTAEQGQAISHVHAQRLRGSLPAGQGSGHAPAVRQSHRALALRVPDLTQDQWLKLRALPDIGTGAESMVHADHAAGVVYKVLQDNHERPSLGIYPALLTTPDGKLDYRFEPAENPRQVALRAAVITHLGGTPTEIHSVSPEGHIVLKQPLSPDPRRRHLDLTDEAGRLEPDQPLQKEAIRNARQQAGLVMLPEDVLASGFDLGRLFVAVVEGRPYLVTDLQSDNFVGDHQQGTRINDPIIAQIPDVLVAKIPGLQPVIEEAAQAARELGDRSARLFSAAKAPEDTDNVPASELDAAAHAAATSPHNDLPEPTQAQKEAGNYKLGHARIAGLDISIENPAGSQRQGVDPNGKPWSVDMRSHYGYIRSIYVPASDKSQPQGSVAEAHLSRDAAQALSSLPFAKNARNVIDKLLSGIRAYNTSETKPFTESGIRNSQADSDSISAHTFRQKLLSLLNIPTQNSRRRINASLDQSTTDGLAADTYLFGNSRNADAIRAHGFDLLNVQDKTVVQSHMISAIHDGEIGHAVIQLIPVDMMDMLGAKEFSTRTPLNNQPVLLDRLSLALEDPVMIGRIADAVATNLPIALASRIAEESAPHSQAVRGTMQNSPTKGALDFTHDDQGKRISTVGKDKDHVDIFVKPGTPTDYAGPVFVVNQKNPATGRFDEHKVILGGAHPGEASRLYHENYAPDWKGLDSIATFPDVPTFKKWLATGDMKAKAVSVDKTADAPAPSSGADTLYSSAKARSSSNEEQELDKPDLFHEEQSPVAQAAPSALENIGWNHLDKAAAATLDRAISAVRASSPATAVENFIAHTYEHTAPGQVVKKAVDFLKKELVPASVIPREVRALLTEMQIKQAFAAETALDLSRALSGKAKFSDIGYPADFATKPADKKKLYLAMAGDAPMESLPPELQAVATKLRRMLIETGKEAVRAGRMSMDTFEGLQANYMPHYYEDDINPSSIGGVFKQFKLGLKDINAQRSTAWHITDTSTLDPKTQMPRLVSWDDKGKKWRFNSKEHRDAFYSDFVRKQAVTMLNQQGKDVTNLLAALDPATKQEVRAELRALTREQLDRPEELSAATRAVLRRAIDLQKARYKPEAPLSVEQQEKAGLIMDPVYAVTRYLAQMKHDNATAELFNAVAARPEWTSDAPLAGFVQIPDNPRFGRLAGKHVEKSIAEQITDLVEAPDTALKVYDTMLGWWKAGHTVYNPGTHVRNVLGNFIFTQFAGVSPWNPGNWKHYADGLRALRNGGDGLKEMYEHGVLGADFSRAELKSTIRSLLPDPNAVEEGNPGLVMGIGKSVGRFLHNTGSKVHELYGLEDDVFKAAAFTKARAMGMSAEEAAAHVRKWFPYYDQLGTSTTLKGIKRTIMPFMSFYRESLRILGTAAKERPLALAAGLALPSIITQLSASALGLDDDDLAQIRKDMRGKGKFFLQDTPLFSMLLPVKSGSGQYQMWDLSNVLPFADHLGRKMEDNDPSPPWQYLAKAALTGGPIMNTIYALATGKDSFGNRNIWEEDMTPTEKATAAAKQVVSIWAPSVAPGGSAFNTVAEAGTRTTNKTLEKRDPTQAVLRGVFGLDVRNANPNLYRMADEYRAAHGLPKDPAFDGGTTGVQRARAQIFAQAAQDKPDYAAIAKHMAYLRDQGHDFAGDQDLQRLLFYRNPQMILKGKENQDGFMASLRGIGRQQMQDTLREFHRIQSQAPLTLAKARPLMPPPIGAVGTNGKKRVLPLPVPR